MNDDIVIARPDGTLVPAAAVIDDLSFHRVWWRKHWVLWYDEPWQFEDARPWTHSVPIGVHIAAVLLGLGLGILGVLLGAPWPAAVAAMAFAGGWAGAVAIAEYRFARWVNGNDGRALLDAFLPPRQHHPELLSSHAAQQALRDLTTARDVVEKYAHAHDGRLRHWSTNDSPWVPLSDLTAEADDSLLQLVAAAAAFRNANEEWGSEDDWDAAFRGEPAPSLALPRLFTRLRRATTAPTSDYVKTAQALTAAVRQVKNATATAHTVPRPAPSPLVTTPAPSPARAPRPRRSYGTGASMLDDVLPMALLIMSFPAVILIGVVIFNFASATL